MGGGVASGCRLAHRRSPGSYGAASRPRQCRTAAPLPRFPSVLRRNHDRPADRAGGDRRQRRNGVAGRCRACSRRSRPASGSYHDGWRIVGRCVLRKTSRGKWEPSRHWFARMDQSCPGRKTAKRSVSHHQRDVDDAKLHVRNDLERSAGRGDRAVVSSTRRSPTGSGNDHEVTGPHFGPMDTASRQWDPQVGPGGRIYTARTHGPRRAFRSAYATTYVFRPQHAFDPVRGEW